MSGIIMFAAVGTAVGILSGMGVGSGGILVLFLCDSLNASQLAAQGSNLLFFVYSGAASLFIHGRKRNLDFTFIGICSLLGVIGSFIGAYISNFLPETQLRKIFGYLLIGAAVESIVELVRKIKVKRDF